jgi:drug/metabolite transporter (DMT)-like permease
VQQHRPTLALILRLCSALVFSIMFLLVKLAAERGISVGEIVFWRQVPSAPLVLAWLAFHGQVSRLRTQRLGTHALRAGVGMTNMGILFTATSLLPLAETTTLGFTTPLFAVLIAAIILRETVGPWRWAAVLLGFAGVLVIAQPGGGHDLDPLGATLALVAALIVAIINYQIRDLGRTEEPLSIVFWFGVFGTLIGAMLQPFVMTSHDATEWALLIGMGLLGFVGQIFLTASLRFGSVSSVIVMDYSGLIWAAMLGWLVWDHLPPLTTWLGAPLIIGAGLLIAWREHRHARPPSPVSPADAE